MLAFRVRERTDRSSASINILSQWELDRWCDGSLKEICRPAFHYGSLP